jgi:hypothetical protein
MREGGGSNMAIIDGDGHLFETRNLWQEHAPKADHDKVLSIVTDDLGYSWLAVGGEKTDTFVWWGEPGDWKTGNVARQTAEQRQGQQAYRPYDELPEDHWSPQARLKRVNEWGIDYSVQFPQWTLNAPRVVGKDSYEHIQANFSAWNRFAVEVQQETKGRLLPSGLVHFTGDFSYAEKQLAALSAGGVRLACMSPGLINGKALSHPDNDKVWRLFLQYNVAPFWHISTSDSVVAKEWVYNEPYAYKVLEASFSRVQPQLCIADMAVNGTFEKFPDLRLSLIEYRPDWLPQLLFRIDNSWRMRWTHTGQVLTPSLTMEPSGYIRRQVRLGVFPEDNPVELSSRLGSNDMLMWGGDYPHPEGYNDPLNTFENVAHVRGTAIEESVYGGTAAWVLHLNEEKAAV